MSLITSLGITTNWVMWIEALIGLVFVLARYYTRKFVIHSVGWDDYWIIISLVLFFLFCAFTTASSFSGLGALRKDLDPAAYSMAMKWELIGQSICIFAIPTSKSSVALFLLRIVVNKWHRYILWFCIVSTVIAGCTSAIGIFFQCVPVQKIWDPTVEGYYKLKFIYMGLFTAGWSSLMDFVLALLPWHVLWSLNMKRKEKYTVAIGLSLGVFAGACGIVRTILLQSLNAEEYIHDTVPMVLWSSTKLLVTIIYASVIVLRPLYVKIRRGSKADSSDEPHSFPLPDYPSKRKLSSVEPETKIYQGVGMTNTTSSANKHNDPTNTSEESILRELREDDFRFGTKQGIRRTDAVTVTFEAKNGDKFIACEARGEGHD
ncbi:hypothetical protein HYALB_00013763 [Hymenoscyphus albidus]|uniref:Rhodopsin domain-containing protein n=1 Tax=Hymenoscyphus albidus TaxID=595503 RepID=A0A9N9PZL9_9HELO|nr:hypothetical protein HYALB_00013763 [Hymenoscyphus albidus]